MLRHIHLHIPNLYIGGIEQWALGLIRGIPEFRWTVSTPPGAPSHPVGKRSFHDVEVVEFGDGAAHADIIVASCRVPRTEKTTVMVSHGTAGYYQSEIAGSSYDHATAVSTAAAQSYGPGRTCFMCSTRASTVLGSCRVVLGHAHARISISKQTT